MHKVVFAAALAVGLITAPMSQFVSSAAAQQVSAEKNAKMKKEPSAGQLATRERQKKCGAEWKEAKASNKIRERNDLAKVLERLQQAPQVRRQLTLLQRAHAKACA
jgi:thymidylate synthase